MRHNALTFEATKVLFGGITEGITRWTPAKIKHVFFVFGFFVFVFFYWRKCRMIPFMMILLGYVINGGGLGS